jgi:hypothetical protein
MRTLPTAVLGAVLALAAVAGCGHHGRGTAAASASPAASGAAPAASAPAPVGSVPPAPTPSGSARSGITGTTLLLACPVPREKPCPPRPASMTLTVTDVRTTDVVATVTSGRDGTFRVDLPPGRYLIRQAGPTSPLLLRVAPVTVDVRDGAYTTVTLRVQANVE